MAMSFDNLRIGRRYYLRNYGEEFTFQVEKIPEEGLFVVKDLLTLELYELNTLVQYGKGKDFELIEL
jgi:hypothetical protein